MPVLQHGNFSIDYTDEGRGETVVLIHSSVSGNRQWRALTEGLSDRYRVRAINLFGYGETTRWPGAKPQSLYAQAQLVLALCRDVQSPVHLVGHSFGGAVALKTASLLGAWLGSLVLLEPNPFHLLQQAGRTQAYLEARSLRDHVQSYGAVGDWAAVAERFADYWLGDGAWSAMPEKRRAAFMDALPPNIHEWDAVMEEQAPIAEWKLPATRTLVVSDPATRRPVREIVELFREACPHWSFQSIEGGHMAPLTHPERVNPLVRGFLDAAPA
ncbi:MAG TPA: alpha/beta hydrolase [Burkholderiales bacterium]|jgi:pimeloyl-ACP methyl ester carboxylesterase|nr:alpha/beta hydrolase [Burkholderiales bacterium]